jgi:lysozyme family protein
MTAANAPRCVANTLIYEGGFTKTPHDPGNWTGGKVGKGVLLGTNFGIAANTYPHLDIPNLKKSEAIAIFVRDYWPKAQGDMWPKGIDQVTYDAVVNSGPGRLSWTLQAIGDKSLIGAVTKARAANENGRIAIVKKQVAIRVAFLRGLSTFGRFGPGWIKRCVGMEAIGVRMVLEDFRTDPGPVLKKEAEKAKTKEVATGGTATGTAAGGGGGATQLPEPSTWDWTAWLFVGCLTVAAVGIVAFFAWQWWKNRSRWQAYIDVARGTLGEWL